MKRFFAFILLIFVALGGASATTKKNSKETARLIEAVTSGDEDTILSALANGADANAMDADKTPAIVLVAPQSLFGKERKIIEAFVKAKVKIDAVDKEGATALMYAASAGRDGIVRLLLQNEAKVDLRDNDGWTALMYAANSGSNSGIKELLEAGADIAAKNTKGWTPLTIALHRGRGSAAQELMKAGAKLPEKAPNDMTPILLATYGRDLAGVRLVLENGATLDGVDSDGWPSLSVAAYNGDGQIVMELLRAGADTSLKDKEGKTALDRAKENERTEIVAILGGPWTPAKPAGGQNISIPCSALGGKVNANFRVDGSTLIITTQYPKPLTWYLGGGNTNRAKSATKLTYEGSFVPTYYFDTDMDAKTGSKDQLIKEAVGSEYDIDYMQYGTSVTLHYQDSEGKDRTKSVYANEIDANVEKEGEMVDLSDIPTDDRPRADNENGVLITKVPLSIMQLTPGKTVRVTPRIGSCGAGVASKVKL